MTNLLNLTIELAQSGNLTNDELDRLTRDLLSEIEQDIKPVSVNLATRDVPPGVKSVEAVTIGLIVLALIPVAADKLADLLIDWCRRNQEHKITITVPVDSAEISIEYNPAHMKPEYLKQEIAKAIAAIKARQ